MALYHLSVKPVSRGAGRSAVAAAAYRTAEALHDARTGQAHDYTRKRGVEARLLLVPQRGGVAAFEGEGWTAERERLWNAAEAAERRKDARVAREYEVALPCELDAAGRHRLVAAFAGELARRHGVAVDAAIHAPGREGDQRNWHAHVLATTRRVTGDEIGGKAEVELSDAARAKLGLGKAAEEIEGLRAVWGDLVNRALAQAQAEARVDHRSYKRQGLGHLEAMQHAGPAVAGMERTGEARRRRAQERAGAEAAAPAAGPAQEPAVSEPVAPSGPAPEGQPFLAAQHGPGTAREGATGQGAVRPVSATGPGLDRPARAPAGVHGAGPEPVTRVGQRNAAIQAHNRAVEAARRAVEQAQRVLRELERVARRALGLAQGLGAQAEQARERAAVREAERQREARAAEQRAELARTAAELRRQEERARLRQTNPVKAADDHWRRRAEREKRERRRERDEPGLEM